MLTKDFAICIRATDYSETSQIVIFFTRENGKIGAIAKGSKRPKSAFDGPIEILSFGEIVFSDSNRERLSTLTEFQQQNLIHETDSLFALNCSLFGAELVNCSTHDFDPHPALFDNFFQFLQSINMHCTSSIKDKYILRELILFQLALLKEIGLMPVLNACANCKTSYQHDWPEGFFSSNANGLICRDCETSFPDRVRLSKSVVNCVAEPSTIATHDYETLREVERILVNHFTEIIQKPLRVANYILNS